MLSQQTTDTPKTDFVMSRAGLTDLMLTLKTACLQKQTPAAEKDIISCHRRVSPLRIFGFDSLVAETTWVGRRKWCVAMLLARSFC